MNLVQFLSENSGHYDTDFAEFNLCQDGMVEMKIENGYSITSDDWWELCDFLSKHSEQEFRICEVCGKPYDAGYMHEEGFHACSEECVKADANDRYGKEGVDWKWCDDWTDEEREMFNSDEHVGCLIYKDNDGEWELDETFYTEWF